MTVTEALECLHAHPDVHSRNTFAHSVATKFATYGALTEPQHNALVKSLQRDHDRAAEAVAPKGQAPVGRQTVTGEILSVKEKVSAYGVALKMLVRLPNNSKVWVSAPKDRKVAKGETITFTATFEQSRDDQSFAFGTRPEYSGVTPVKAAESTDFNDVAAALTQEPAAAVAPKRSALEELLDELATE